MHDLHFEDRLRAAAPRVSVPLELAEHRKRIMRDLRNRRRKRRTLWAASCAVVVALVGGGTVAVAGNGTHATWNVSADNVLIIPGPDGQTCSGGINIETNGIPDDSELARTARAIVASIDLRKLDTSKGEAALAAENGKPYPDGTPGTVHYTPQQIKQLAMFDAVATILADELKARGLQMAQDGTEPVFVAAQMMGCD